MKHRNAQLTAKVVEDRPNSRRGRDGGDMDEILQSGAEKARGHWTYGSRVAIEQRTDFTAQSVFQEGHQDGPWHETDRFEKQHPAVQQTGPHRLCGLRLERPDSMGDRVEVLRQKLEH